MFGPLWETQYAEITIRYKSGRTYHFQTTVENARKRALAAIDRKGPAWIKVVVPNDNNSKARVSTWYGEDRKWRVAVSDLPRTKD